jgi:hypothetical protein
MTGAVDGNWKLLVKNVYNDRGMVIEQRVADGHVFQYDYIFGMGNQVGETIVTFPSGKKRKFFFEHGVLAKEE